MKSRNCAQRAANMQKMREFCSTIMDMECLNQLRMAKFGYLIRSVLSNFLVYTTLNLNPPIPLSQISFSDTAVYIELYAIHPFANQWFGFLAEDTFYLCVWLLCGWANCQCLHSGSFFTACWCCFQLILVSFLRFIYTVAVLKFTLFHDSFKIMLLLHRELPWGIAFYLRPVKLTRPFHKVPSFLLMYLLLASRHR